MRRRVSVLVLAVAGLCATVVAPVTAAGSERLVITYEVRGRGNVSDLEALAAEAAAAYADPRGWSLGGSVRFDRVASGGDFTLWLAADELMSTFGGACDVEWSCRNGRHVVINEDRWLGASDSWNETGASLATYRQMVLNHETGHWLGFGHGSCSGSGRLAPVMQQQSMSLRGCTPNPWPLVSEQAGLAARRRVPLVQSGAVAGPSPTTTTARPPGRPAAAPLEDRCVARMPDVAHRPWRRCF